MKKTKIFVLFVLLAFIVVSCNKENDVVSNTVRQETSIQEGMSTNAYAQLTHQYLAAVDDDSTPPDLVAPRQFWRNLWKGVLQFLHADGNAMFEAYGSTQNLPITLIYGVGSSIADVTKSKEMTIDSGLSDLQVLAGAENAGNKFDLIGYNHYVVVNKVLNDMDQYNGISDIEARDRAIAERIKQEVAILYPTDQIKVSVVDYTAYYNSLKLQPGESYTEGTTYYDRVFSSNGETADPAFVQILQLYMRSYEAVKEGYIDAFVAYSKTMEQAVEEDNNLKTDVKEALLIGMATYRYGIKYYANLK